MKIHVTGKAELFDAPTQKKLDARYARLSKLLGRRSEKELHLILKTERHMQRAELTLNLDGQPQAGIHAAPDQFSALAGAIDKLEKQLLKLHDKRLSGKRRGGNGKVREEETPAAAAVEPPAPPRILRGAVRRKPMTVDEAVLDMADAKIGYVAYRDARTGRLSVLVRRKDGNFDLIEN